MKILILLALIESVVCFDAPHFELSEEERHVNVDYHNHVIDEIVWSNSTHANETYLEMLIDQLTSYLDLPSV